MYARKNLYIKKFSWFILLFYQHGKLSALGNNQDFIILQKNEQPEILSLKLVEENLENNPILKMIRDYDVQFVIVVYRLKKS